MDSHEIELISAVEKLVTKVTGIPSKVSSTEAVSGGCINSVKHFRCVDGRDYLVKTNQNIPGLFESESAGLAAIRATETIEVPNVIGYGATKSGIQFLILDFIVASPPAKFFPELFGRQLALLHSAGEQKRFGFNHDNFIGSNPQKNTWRSDWVEFFAVERLEFQLKLANRNNVSTSELNQSCNRLISKLDRVIGVGSDFPALIHGDLWSGNLMVSPSGRPVLIDPAAYFGSREAEFGMTTLFGGFNSDFYDAYNEASPLSDGWQRRVDVYQLYHLLNHLNIFGSSYLSQCLQVLRKLD